VPLIRDDDDPRLPVAVMLVLGVTLACLLLEPVTVTVESGYFVFEPAWIRLRVRVEPEAENRGLTVALHGDDYDTSSYEQLDGDHAPRTRWVTFKDVPAGVYTVTAIVERAEGRPWRATAGVTVMGRQ